MARKTNLRHEQKQHWWLRKWGGYGLFLLLGILLACGYQLLAPPDKSPAPPLHAADMSTEPAPQPWGNLEYTTLRLERPEESFPEIIPDPEPIQWFFENFSREQLRALLESIEFSAEERKVLLNESAWQQAPDGIKVLPSLELVRDMNMTARQKLYAVLGRSSKNPTLQYPCRFEADYFDDWLAHSGLTPQKQALVRKLSFRKGDTVYFYDGALLEWYCRPADERKKVAKALTQTTTLLMKLRVTPQSDVDSLIAYWGQHGRGKSMRPFLEGLTQVPEGVSVSVSYFFPSFARLLLYTYPNPRNDQYASQKTCYYTAMNFFNETPDDSLLDPESVPARLKSDYTEVQTNSVFGDLLVLQKNKEWFHMAVYIADDVVFTKNGYSYLAPWVLMKRTQMLKEYEADVPFEVRVFRKKPQKQ